MINKRIFGSPIPINVQKKLEARQKVAEGGKKPGDSINSQYDVGSTDTYSDLISSNFDMQADLSSRTPFVRMWTGVALVNERKFEITSTDDAENITTGLSTDDVKKDNDLSDIETILQKIKYEELSKKIYILGTHNLSTIDSLNPLSSQQNSDETTFSSVFPDEHGVERDNNKFLKPQAGITGITSETQGVMGTIKKTNVKFIVQNFADFDQIYNKYFMRPGAQVFVDFGWDALKDSDGAHVNLYDPAQILAINATGIQQEDDTAVEAALYGEAGEYYGKKPLSEDGFVTKCNGDVETIVGIVTGYDSKIQENGTVECDLEITSKNSALMLFPKNPTGESVEVANARYDFDFDTLIFFEQAYNLGNTTDRERLQSAVDDLNTANTSHSIKNDLEWAEYIEEIKKTSFDSSEGKYTPSLSALISGLFVYSNDDASDSYISWGFLEDRFLNRYFGHGDSSNSINDEKGKLEVKIDSSDGFTGFQQGFIKKQKQINEAPNFVIPEYWDITYNNSEQKQKSGKTRVDRATELDMPETSLKNILDSNINEIYGEGAKSENLKKTSPIGVTPIITNFDKKLLRVPIREIFVSIKIVKEAFKDENNKSFRDIIQKILDKINDEAYGLWDWQLVGEDNSLKINDMNYSEIGLGQDRNTKKDNFDKIFKFEVMSKNSIVKSYDVSLSMPEGAIGSMYAIQAMSGTPGKMYPASSIMESHSALQSLTKKIEVDQRDLGFKYLPDLSAYNSLNQSSAQMNTAQKVEYYKQSMTLAPKGTSKKSYATTTIDIPKSPASLSKKKSELDEDAISGAIDSKSGHDTEKRKSIALKSLGSVPVLETADDYYRYVVTMDFKIDTDQPRPIPLPMKLSLTTYGISTLKPGDVFRVDYLPEIYLQSVYFQVLSVSHSVGSDGWYTSLETQFRISPHAFEDVNSTTDITEADAVKRENLKSILTREGYAEDIIQKVISVAAPKRVDKDKELTPVLNPSALTGGADGLLEKNIDDGMAYMWDGDATAFSTAAPRKDLFPNAHNKSFYNRPTTGKSSNSGGLRPYNHVDGWRPNVTGVWDYIKGTGSPPTLTAPKNYFNGSKVITNRNFKSLLGYMTYLKPHNTQKYEFFSRLFEFEIFAEYPVLISNPLYYWGKNTNRYNGYGFYRNTWYSNTNKYTYVSGIYRPREKCYLIINVADPTRHWAVVPTSVNLEHYNVSTKDARFSKSEWNEEQVSGPEVY